MIRIQLILFLFITNTTIGQNFQWASSVGGVDVDQTYSITTDAFGNSYSIGYYNGTVDFDPGAAIVNLTSVGGSDIFIRKLDVNGDLIWAKSMGGPYPDWGLSVTTDIFDNVYLTGVFQGTADFDPGPGVFNLTQNGVQEIFVLKLDNNGNFQWAKAMGSSSVDVGTSITSDLIGNVYITGGYSGIVDFDPNGGIANLTSNGSTDVFVQKLDSNGNFLWVKGFGGASDDEGYSIHIGKFGNIFITGDYDGTVDFDPGVAVFNLTSVGGSDIFIQKLDVNGDFLWVKSMGGALNDIGKSIVTDDLENVYTIGTYRNTVDFDPSVGIFNLTSNGETDAFIQKLDSNGNLVWVNSMGGIGYDYGNSITLDALGNIYSVGDFYDIVDFNPGVGTSNLTSNGGNDLYVQKLDSNGNLLWVISTGGINDEYGRSITLDATGNIYLTGNFWNVADFDPSAGTSNLTSIGLLDVFLLKLGSTVGINDYGYNLNVNVYPNPTSNHFTITGLNKPYNLSIYNSLGQFLYSDNILNPNKRVDVSKYSKGLIFIRIESENGVKYCKILKQ